MKILFVSHTANFAKFNQPLMSWCKEQGWEVHYASAGEEPVRNCDKHIKISFTRSPISPGNILAFFQLRKLIKANKYDIVHAHTPSGGAIARLASRSARHRGVRVIYTAHGFHFYDGAPLINWIIYYPIEKLLSHITDDLVTINSEDYRLAKRKFHAIRTHRIYGAGANLTRFTPVSEAQKDGLREKHHFAKHDKILIYVAELNKNKNQQFLINLLARTDMSGIKLLLVGDGPLKKEYQALAEQLNLAERISFLGYRYDVQELYQLSDIVVSTSIREGLGLSVIEGMACGLPVVCVKNRGHAEIVKDGHNGWLVPQNNADKFAGRINELFNSKDTLEVISKQNIAAVRVFSLDQTISDMARIYLNNSPRL